MPASSNPFHDATVSALLDGVAARYPDREALVLDDERLTFADFRQRAETLARALCALGLSVGDKVQKGKLRNQALGELGIVGT